MVDAIQHLRMFTGLLGKAKKEKLLKYKHTNYREAFFSLI